MGGIEGSNKFIKFGTHKVETGKSDGVKRETVSGNGTKNKFNIGLNKLIEKLL